MPRRFSEYRVPVLRLIDYAWRITAILLCLFAIRFLQQTSAQMERLANLIALEGSYVRNELELQGGNANAQLTKLNTSMLVGIGRIDSQASHTRIEASKQAKAVEVTTKQESKKLQEVLTDTLQPTSEAVEKLSGRVAAVAVKAEEKPQVVITPAPVTVVPSAAPKPQEKALVPEPEKRHSRWGNFWRALTFREVS